MSNLFLRILTGLIGAPLVLGVVYLGGWPFAAALAVFTLAAQHEFYRFARAGGAKPDVLVGLMAGSLILIRPLFPPAIPIVLVLLLLWLAVSPLRPAEKQPVSSVPATLAGIVYPTLFLSFLLDLRLARGEGIADFEAFALTASTFLLIWATDTIAYFGGKAFGRHPLAPIVSPKKTWEGSIIGAFGAVVLAVVLKFTLLAFLAWENLVVMALLCGIVSQLGDLTESKMKRSVGMKDSGDVLPGHGGILDRLDAMVLAAPLVYLYLAYVARLFEL